MRLRHLLYASVLIAAISMQWSEAAAMDVRGNVAVETRVFPKEPLYDGQSRGVFPSLVAEVDLYQIVSGGSVTFKPFLRLDWQDDERTHADIRLLYYEHVRDAVEMRVGIGQVFWGVTESQHLVDIINQTDNVENIDGEDKLGQPMVNFSFVRDWGTTDLFVMTGFRERTFPGSEGRLRFALPVDTDAATFESSNDNWHVDWAVRYFNYFGPLDIGVSYFNGTGREPTLTLGSEGNLFPYYPLIDQTGLDAQLILGGWLWKLEVISRGGQGDRFAALTGGYEYTFVGLFESAIDLGILTEYLWDERGNAAPTPFDNDIFAGARLAMNDVQSTSVLAGAIIDLDNQSTAILVEADRRLGSTWTLAVEARLGVVSNEPFYEILKQDGFLQIDIARHF